MAEPTLTSRWRIVSSTSRFFPIWSWVHLDPLSADPSRFRFQVSWEGHSSLQLFEGTYPDVTAPPGAAVTLRGGFRFPGPQGHPFELVVTVCPGYQDFPKYLCGQLYDLEGRGDGATGVWVAEEDRPGGGGEEG
jgi:hypothetical protein